MFEIERGIVLRRKYVAKLKSLLFGECGAIALGEGIVRLFPRGTIHLCKISCTLNCRRIYTNQWEVFFNRESDQTNLDSDTILISRRGSRGVSLTTGSTRMRMASSIFVRRGNRPTDKTCFIARRLVLICWSSSLETEFCRSVGGWISNVDWLNAGVDGYNTSDALLALERVDAVSGRGLAVFLLGQRHLGERLVQSTIDKTRRGGRVILGGKRCRAHGPSILQVHFETLCALGDSNRRSIC